jgi:hypothetical protein
MFKHYVTPSTEEECKRLSAEKAEAMGCDMTDTKYWWDWGEDEQGWYLLMEEDSNL